MRAFVIMNSPFAVMVLLIYNHVDNNKNRYAQVDPKT